MPKQIPVTEFDILTQPDYIQLIKAILPFMEYNMQRRVSALIRTSELKNTIRFIIHLPTVIFLKHAATAAASHLILLLMKF